MHPMGSSETSSRESSGNARLSKAGPSRTQAAFTETAIELAAFQKGSDLPSPKLRCEKASPRNELQPQRVPHRERGGLSLLCTVRCLIPGELTNRSHALEKFIICDQRGVEPPPLLSKEMTRLKALRQRTAPAATGNLRESEAGWKRGTGSVGTALEIPVSWLRKPPPPPHPAAPAPRAPRPGL